MVKKGFVDKGLYGLKEKLSNVPSEETIEEEQQVYTEQENDKVEQNTLEQPNRTTQESVETPKLDKKASQALLKRKQEYHRTKELVIDKINEISETIEDKTFFLEQKIKTFNETQAKLKSILLEIQEVNEKDWQEDYTFQLGSAMKTVENARLQYLLIETKLLEAEEKIKDNTPENTYSSIIPEIISLNFSQLFKMGLSFMLPLIIGIIIASILISLVIFIVMGGILLV